MRLTDYPTRDTLDGSEFLYAAKPGVGNSFKIRPSALTSYTFKELGQLNKLQAQDARDASTIVQDGEQATVAYAADLSMTSTLQRVSYLNDVYAPLGSKINFVTTGNWEADRLKFRLVGGITGAKLLQEDGATAIAMTAPLPQTFSANLYERVVWSLPDVLEFFSPAERLDILTGAYALDHTAAIQRCINQTSGRGFSFGDGRQYNITRLSMANYKGQVYCSSTLKAIPNTAIDRMIDLEKATVRWYGKTTLDASQTSATAIGDARAQIGVYLLDARDCEFDPIVVTNARVFRPVFVSGRSAIASAVTADMGSKRIKFRGLSCDAFTYSSIDEGVYIVVSSDFYAGTNGGACFATSNGVKVADYLIDTSVSLARTTEEIFFEKCDFTRHDRIALLNCKGIHFSDCTHKLAATRGLACSPTVEDVTWNGGHLSGGGAVVVGNYACKNFNLSSFSVSSDFAVGQKRTFTFGYGTTDVNVSSVTGSGCADRHLFIEGAKRIKFDQVNLRQYAQGNTTLAVSINGGGAGNSSSFVSEDITVANSSLQSNYGLAINENAGTATVAIGGLTLLNSVIDKAFSLFNAGIAPARTNGEIRWISSRATVTGSAEDLSSASFVEYSAGNLNMKMWDTYAAGGATTYPSFASVRYFVPVKDGGGGDATRNPAVLAYIKKSGGSYFQPLLYGVDWFCDGTVAGTMYDRIRMYVPTSIGDGDTVAIHRLY